MCVCAGVLKISRYNNFCAHTLSALVLFLNECFHEPVGDEEGGGQGEVGDGARASPLAQPISDGRTLVCVAVYRREIYT